MSTKIYNGYYSDLSLDKLLLKFKEEVKRFEDIKLKHFSKVLVGKSIEIYDTKLSKGESCDINDTIGELYDKYQNEINDSKKNNLRVSNVDFSASCCLFPCGRKTLILFYSDNNSILELWDSLDYIHEYHYQNQTDRPNNITNREWNLRRKNWNKVLGGDGWGIPAHNGYVFTFTFIDAPFYYDLKIDFKDYITSDTIRANYLLHNKFVDEKYKIIKNNEGYEFKTSDYFKIMDEWKEWKNTEEYKTEIEKIIPTLVKIQF